MIPPEECPNCHASMRGIPIPQEIKYLHDGQEFFYRVISIYDRNADRHDHWKCPDCQHEWDKC
jgi:hypothetical protein